MLTTAAFLVAIGVLVIVHEFGHYRMAIACGVRVIRFSVGLGPKILGWTSARSGTEFIVAALPLGGFVKMLDEREGPVLPAQRHQAFNTQTVGRRAAIVASGPLANFVLAVLLYAVVNWIGIEQPQAVLPKPVENSLFATAGFLGGERVDRAGYEDEELEDIVSFDDLRWRLLRGALEQRDMRLEYRDAAGTPGKVIAIPLSRLESTDADSLLLKKVGVLSAFSQARIGDTFTGGAAQEAGLRNGDVVVSVDTKAVTDAPQLRDVIRQGGRTGLAQTQQWKIRREGTEQTIAVTPKVELENGQSIGRVGAYIGAMPALVLVRLGPLAGMQRALYQTWEVSLLTVKMLGKILVGEASLKSLSGPITIADFAGRSAANGIAHYLGFLALISISLGVLNLLPVPVLDGGHLMYYLWESLTGKPVSDSWMEGMQRIGLAMLLLLMSVAIFNDVTRLLG